MLSGSLGDIGVEISKGKQKAICNFPTKILYRQEKYVRDLLLDALHLTAAYIIYYLLLIPLQYDHNMTTDSSLVSFSLS